MLGSKEKTMRPDLLYHYTSIQALALILYTTKIRFNRLDKIDDLQEAKSSDLGNLGRFYFVSCWSDSSEESIPLWSMYTPNMAGVRIKLPATMFKEYTIQPQVDGFIQIKAEINCPLPYERIITDQYTVHPTIFNPDMFLRKVEYTDDKAKLCPTVRSKEANGFSYNLGTSLGVCKRTEWRFQNEWRYIIIILPEPIRYPSLTASQCVQHFSRQIHSSMKSGSLPFEDFYLDLGTSAINNIEVVLGPRCTKGDEVIVEALLSKYCANPSLKSSILKGSIR